MLGKVLLFFFFLIFSYNAFGDVEGVWPLSGIGCRDSDLSPESHVSKTLPEAISAIFTINSNGTISFLVRESTGNERTHTGTYTFQNNILEIQPDDMAESLSLSLVASYLIYVDDTAPEAACGQGKKAVIVFGKTT